MPAMRPAEVPQAEVPRIYGRVAGVYDVWGWLTESKARHRCLERAAVRDGESLLEVAVGTGITFVELARRNPHGRNVGIDLTPAMLKRAQRRVAREGLRAELAVGDAHNLEFPDRSFDLLVNNYMFDLLPQADFAPVLGEFRRVLRPGGRLVLVNMAQGERPHHRVYDWLYVFRPELLGGCRGVAMKPEVETAGFASVERQYLAQLGFPSEIITAHR